MNASRDWQWGRESRQEGRRRRRDKGFWARLSHALAADGVGVAHVRDLSDARPEASAAHRHCPAQSSREPALEPTPDSPDSQARVVATAALGAQRRASMKTPTRRSCMNSPTPRQGHAPVLFKPAKEARKRSPSYPVSRFRSHPSSPRTALLQVCSNKHAHGSRATLQARLRGTGHQLAAGARAASCVSPAELLSGTCSDAGEASPAQPPQLHAQVAGGSCKARV